MSNKNSYINIRGTDKIKGYIKTYRADKNIGTDTQAATELVELGYQLYELKKQNNNSDKRSMTDYLEEILKIMNRSSIVTFSDFKQNFNPDKHTGNTLSEVKNMLYSVADDRTNKFINGIDD